MRRQVTTVYLAELGCRAIVVGEEVFDWGMDGDALRNAMAIARDDPAAKDVIMVDIQKSLVGAFSEFVGRECTLADINLAIRNGHIDT